MKSITFFLALVIIFIFYLSSDLFQKKPTSITPYYGHWSNNISPRLKQTSPFFTLYFSTGFEKDTIFVILNKDTIYNNIISTEWLIQSADTLKIKKGEKKNLHIEINVNKNHLVTYLNSEYNYFIIDWIAIKQTIFIEGRKNEPSLN